MSVGGWENVTWKMKYFLNNKCELNLPNTRGPLELMAKNVKRFTPIENIMFDGHGLASESVVGSSTINYIWQLEFMVRSVF